MSIIISGMEMPKCCADCDLLYDYIGCSVTGTHADFAKMDSERLPNCPLKETLDNALAVERRMFYVQETVNTILNSCTGNTDVDKAFRNAARLIQNAIDGKSVDFEEIERSEEE